MRDFGSKLSDDMNPVDWALLPLKRYAQFHGRAPRAEYWWFYLGTTIVGVILAALDRLLGTNGGLADIVNLALLLPWVAVTVRRLHDTDRSGWWLVGLAGAVFAVFGLFVALGLLGTAMSGGGSSGAAAFTSGILAILIVLGAVITFLAFMVLPGTEGSNRYGSDPYGGHDDLEEVFA